VLDSGKTRTLALDARVPLEKIADREKRRIFSDWMKKSAKSIGVDRKIFSKLNGAVFEIRQGYKSKDSKRQNADIANAASAYANAYLPCAAILSAQIDGDIMLRYRMAKWCIVTGVVGEDDPVMSTYDFTRLIVGYDLAAFFQRNSQKLKYEIDAVLKALLAPETT
jgi:hypothetical protein